MHSSSSVGRRKRRSGAELDEPADSRPPSREEDEGRDFGRGGGEEETMAEEDLGAPGAGLPGATICFRGGGVPGFEGESDAEPVGEEAGTTGFGGIGGAPPTLVRG